MWILTEKGREYKGQLMDDLFLGPGRATWLEARSLQVLDDIDRTGKTRLGDTLKSFWYCGYVDKIEE